MTLRNITVSLWVLLSFLSSSGESLFLIVERTDGRYEHIELTDAVTIKFESGHISFDYGKDVLTVPLTDIKEYRFTPDISQLTNITAESTGISPVNLQYINNILRVDVDGNPVHLEITTIDGIKLMDRNSTGDSELTVDMSHWTAGIYIVRVNGMAHKIIKS